jgi:hypothetical protein
MRAACVLLARTQPDEHAALAARFNAFLATVGGREEMRGGGGGEGGGQVERRLV